MIHHFYIEDGEVKHFYSASIPQINRDTKCYHLSTDKNIEEEVERLSREVPDVAGVLKTIKDAISDERHKLKQIIKETTEEVTEEMKIKMYGKATLKIIKKVGNDATTRKHDI
jgi:predicted RNase H-like nuclease (RuvC/YqgF family)